MANYEHARAFRNHLARGVGINYTMSTPSNFAKVAPGNYTSDGETRVRVQEDGSIWISRNAYADDVVAFVLGCIRSNPTIADGIKLALADFVDLMDARAVKRHGYSNSQAEKDFSWESTSKSLGED